MEEVKARNRRGELRYPEQLWRNVSSEARDLVTKLTARDQYQRLSAKQALEHKWLAQRVDRPPPLLSVLESLRQHEVLEYN